MDIELFLAILRIGANGRIAVFKNLHNLGKSRNEHQSSEVQKILILRAFRHISFQIFIRGTNPNILFHVLC